MRPLGTSPRNVCVCRTCGSDDKADLSGKARAKRESRALVDAGILLTDDLWHLGWEMNNDEGREL